MSTTSPQNARSYRLTQGNLVLVIAAATTLLGIAAVAMVSNSNIAQSLVRATTRQPEPLTELYFINPASLPSHMTAGTNQTISYRVANHENQPTTYHARVTLVQNGQLTVIQTKTFSLADGASEDIAVPFTAPTQGQTVEFVVDLPDQNISIHFRSTT